MPSTRSQAKKQQNIEPMENSHIIASMSIVDVNKYNYEEISQNDMTYPKDVDHAIEDTTLNDRDSDEIAMSRYYRLQVDL